jgi:hypothetical protein
MPETRREMLQKMGIKPLIVVPRVPHINDGIELLRKAFGSCYFDEKRCERGLDALANYQYLFDDKWQTHRERPAHTWASNGADALRQFAQGYRGASPWKAVHEAETTRGSRLKNRQDNQSSWMV